MGKRILPDHELGCRLGHCYDPEARQLPNMTKQIENRIIKKIEPNNMQFVSIAVNGLQGSGKTEYVMFWVWTIQQKFPEQCCTIYADNVDIILAEIKKIPTWVRVVVVVLEDMMSYHDSYSNAKDAKKAADWYLIRHKIKERIGNTGVIYGFLIWQRYTSVNANFRNTDMYAILSPMLNESDADVIKRMIGEEGYQAVRQEYADRQLMDVRRSRVVVHLSALDDPIAGFHDYRYIPAADPDWKYPQLLKAVEYYAPPAPKTKEEQLNEIASDPKNEVAVGWYRRFTGGETLTAIAAEQGKSKSTVSVAIARITKLVGEKART